MPSICKGGHGGTLQRAAAPDPHPGALELSGRSWANRRLDSLQHYPRTMFLQAWFSNQYFQGKKDTPPRRPSPDPKVTEQKALWCIPFPWEKQGKGAYTIRPERVYTIEASDPEKKERFYGGGSGRVKKIERGQTVKN